MYGWTFWTSVHLSIELNYSRYSVFAFSRRVFELTEWTLFFLSSSAFSKKNEQPSEVWLWAKKGFVMNSCFISFETLDFKQTEVLLSKTAAYQSLSNDSTMIAKLFMFTGGWVSHCYFVKKKLSLDSLWNTAPSCSNLKRD